MNKKALVIKNLKKRYSNGSEALKGVDIEIERGDFFALLGPNGAGKSTIIGIITSLVNKTSGKVEIFGVDIDKDFSLAKTFVGVVPQEFNFSIFETVEQIVIQQAGFYGISKEKAYPRCEFLLKELGLYEKRHHKSITLSGGMKRRLMIARALIHSPKLLILDEPTAGVDVELRRSMWEFIKKLNKEEKTTIILTTHYLEEAEELCKNIAIINNGIILENTSMKLLLKKMDFQTLILDIKKNITLVPKIKDFEIKIIDETTLEITLKNTNTLNELIVELNKLNIEVLSVKGKSNKLEELFLKLTQGEKK